MKYFNSPKNVTGIERAASVVGGLALLGNGIRTRGLLGIVQMATGGIALLRGATGHCQMKQLVAEQSRRASSHIERYSHMPLDSDVRSADFEAAPEHTSAGRQAPVIQP